MFLFHLAFSCKDNDVNCHRWINFCASYPSIRKQCPLTCKQCSIILFFCKQANLTVDEKNLFLAVKLSRTRRSAIISVQSTFTTKLSADIPCHVVMPSFIFCLRQLTALTRLMGHRFYITYTNPF